MLLNREALLVLDTADTSLTSLSDDLADRLSEPRGSLPERCKDNKTHTELRVNPNSYRNEHTFIINTLSSNTRGRGTTSEH